jgi:hypothetical protein
MVSEFEMRKIKLLSLDLILRRQNVFSLVKNDVTGRSGVISQFDQKIIQIGGPVRLADLTEFADPRRYFDPVVTFFRERLFVLSAAKC